MTTIPALGTSLTADTVVAADAPSFWIVELDLDGSRRIEFRTSRSGPSWIRDKDVYVERYHNMVVWGPATGEVRVRPHELVVGEYLPYPPTDGIAVASSADPVNQIPNRWRTKTKWPHSPTNTTSSTTPNPSKPSQRPNKKP